MAQDDAEKVMEEVEVIVTIGTRRTGRTAVDTAVPVDVFNRENLDSISSDDMLDTIEKLVPSFIVPLDGADGASFIRLPQLRGLPGDKTLVLINGQAPSSFCTGEAGWRRRTRSGSRNDPKYCCEIH